MNKQKLVGLTVTLLLMLWMVLASVALAAASYQPVEWITYASGKPRFSLSYAGLQPGCKEGQWWNVDRKFWISIRANYNPDNFSIYSYNSSVQRVFKDQSPMGRDLTTTRPYICLGITDVANAGGTANVASNLFVWIR